MATRAEAVAARVKLTEMLEDQGIRGVSMSGSQGEYKLQVNVAKREDAADIPKEVDGVEVSICVVAPAADTPSY